jgi:hypothetical protein
VPEEALNTEWKLRFLDKDGNSFPTNYVIPPRTAYVRFRLREQFKADSDDIDGGVDEKKQDFVTAVPFSIPFVPQYRTRINGRCPCDYKVDTPQKKPKDLKQVVFAVYHCFLFSFLFLEAEISVKETKSTSWGFV